VARARRVREKEIARQVIRFRADHTAYWSFLFLRISRLFTYVILLGVLAVVPFAFESAASDTVGYYLLLDIFDVISGVLALAIAIAFLNTSRNTRAVANAVLAASEADKEAS
jgi:ABC-type multidrug transport system fused ATPase/permease subunit